MLSLAGVSLSVQVPPGALRQLVEIRVSKGYTLMLSIRGRTEANCRESGRESDSDSPSHTEELD